MAAVAIAGLSLASTPVHAAGETYTWVDATNQSVTVAGGNGNVSGTLSKNGGTATDPTFSGSVAFSCNGTSKNATLAMTINSGEYLQVYPTGGHLTVPADAACARITESVAISKSDGSTSADVPPVANECNQGSVTWIMCPFIDNATGAITKLANSVLVPLLEIKPINASTTPDLYHVWQNMVNLAEILFLLVFLVIIFATLTQQDIGFFDQYTIKKIMPRLVIAAILVQASFLISGLMVDIGNVLGSGVTELLKAATGPQSDANIGHILSNLVGAGVAGALAIGTVLSTASWLAVAPLLVSLLISLLVVFLVLGLRFLLITILVVLSPLAMVAWVLPNTRRWANDWMELMMRLILMYPIVIGVISLAGLVNQILPSGASVTTTGFGGLAASIIKPIVVLAAFFIIPLTFRLAGKGLNRAYAIMNGQAQRGQGMLKGSDFWKRGEQERQARKNTGMGRIMDSKAITRLNGSKVGKPLAGAMVGMSSIALMGAPSSRMALNQSNSNIKNRIKKDLDDLDEATPGNLFKALDAYTNGDLSERRKLKAELGSTAPNLLSIASSEAGRAAVVRRLVDMELIGENTLQQFQFAPNSRNPFSVSHNTSREYTNLFSEVGKLSATKPMIVSRMRNSVDNYTIQDASGNTFRDLAGNEVIIKRETGSIDMNVAGKQVRRISGATFGDKHSVDNFKVMGQRTSSNPVQVRDAKDAAMTYAINMDTKALDQSFNPAHRDFNTTPLETRLEWVKDVTLNRDIFLQHNPKILAATTSHLRTDESLSKNVARLAGVNEFDLAGMLPPELANIARDYVYGSNYDSSFNYATASKVVPPAAGARYVGPDTWPS